MVSEASCARSLRLESSHEYENPSIRSHGHSHHTSWARCLLGARPSVPGANMTPGIPSWGSPASPSTLPHMPGPQGGYR